MSDTLTDKRRNGITTTEYRGRVEALRERIRALGLDGAIVYSDEYRCGNTLYLTGYKPINVIEESPQLVYLPVHGDPLVFLGHINVHAARTVSWIEEIHPTLEIRDHLAPFAAGVERLAVVGENLMPVEIYRRLESAFPQAQFLSTPHLVGEMRQEKSADELVWIEKACELGDIGLREAIAELASGKTEIEVCAVAEYATRIRGGDLGCAYIVSAGEHMTLPTWRPTHKRIEGGEVVMVDIAPSFNMYCTDVAITVPIGRPSDVMRRALTTARQVVLDVIEHTRPGQLASSMYDEMAKRLDGAGYSEYFLPYATGMRAIGHGVGLDVVEFPNLGPESDYILEPNMVFGLKLDLHGLPFAGVRCEVTIAITDSGCRSLNKILQEPSFLDALENGIG